MRTEKNRRSGTPGNRTGTAAGKIPVRRQESGLSRRQVRQSLPETDPAEHTDRDPVEADEIRRRKRRQTQRVRRARQVRRQKILLAVAAAVILLLIAAGTQVIHRAWAKSTLSEAVLGYRSTVKKYADKEEISDYVDVLLAIMMVESEGAGRDVMQSSESKGAEPNSLGPEESIEQACIYFAALVDIADDLGIRDDRALIQAYNFGPGYLTYVAEHGGKHTQDLAVEYAKENSGGEKVRYLHLYAIKENGGWIYKFGNMFYEALVSSYTR